MKKKLKSDVEIEVSECGNYCRDKSPEGDRCPFLDLDTRCVKYDKNVLLTLLGKVPTRLEECKADQIEDGANE